MKGNFLFLLLLTITQLAQASSVEDFCQEYKVDQKRIEKVKKNGWFYKSGSGQKYLYGCLDLDWKDEMYSNLCLKQPTEIHLPKIIFFYFDGFGYFRPKEAKAEFKAINLTGKEPAGMIDHGHKALQKYISEFASKKVGSWNRDIEFHYHSGSGTDAIQGIENAEVCYSNILKDLKTVEEKFPELAQPKKVVMGHSNGGMNAITFVNHFTVNENAYFDYLLTIDPVPKAGKFIRTVLGSSEKKFKIKKKENIAKSVNLYQRSSENVLAGVIEIKGSIVEGVDYQTEIYTNHVKILRDPTVSNAVASELVKLMKD